MSKENSSLIGQKFGKLTVLQETKDVRGKKAWLCKCECGNTKIVVTSHLNSGFVQSCGCLKNKIKREDLVGKKFGRLTVIKEGERDKHNKTTWICNCDCGNLEVKVLGERLRSGKTKSCGCISRELALELNKNKITHGLSKTRFYTIWRDMNARCSNKDNISYKYYGEKGIIIEWNTFDDFVMDMYESYTLHVNKYDEKNTTIERKDSNKNYNKENCTWATIQEQNINKSDNRYLEYNNEVHTISDWSRITGINSGTILSRISHGWSIEDTLTKKVRKRKEN